MSPCVRAVVGLALVGASALLSPRTTPRRAPMSRRAAAQEVFDRDGAPCFTAAMERGGGFPLDRFHITSLPEVLDEPQMARVLAMLRRQLDRNGPFTVYYDLRQLRLGLSSRSALLYGNRWMDRAENATPLNRHVKGVAVLVSSPVIRQTARWCVGLVDTPAPIRFVRDDAEARALAETWGRVDVVDDAHAAPHSAARRHATPEAAPAAPPRQPDLQPWWGDGPYYQ